ncbi:MAG: hypothetical protein AMXMBFR23_02790 [Chloroflexota bacterium]
MPPEVVSKRTRTEFREFLVGWTLREIEREFEDAGIRCDRDFEPTVSGQRRSLVERHYHTLDFTKSADVRQLLQVYQRVIDRTEADLPTNDAREALERAIKGLKDCLANDGFVYEGGRIIAANPETRVVLEQQRSISEVTRRAIRDEIIVGQVSWSGKLAESEFLARLYPLDTLPSHDGRFDDMAADIWQHRENNYDWDDDWVFSDSRLNLMDGADEAFLRFLSEMVHPVVRPDTTEARALVETINKQLLVDGWELVEARAISGKPTFAARRRASGAVALPDPTHATDVLSDEYVRELAGKCDSRLASGDLDGAVTVARTLLEAILSELERRLAGAKGDYKGDLPKQFKQVTKLLRMDAERSDLDARFKDVIRGLVMVANGLAPLRNSMSDGHARERKPAPHHARVVVNAAKTVSAFLVESYNYQIETGQLQDKPAPAEEAST